MAITNNGTLIEITGTEVGISGLAGGAGVTVEGGVYTVGSPITEFRITGDLTVSDYETLQLDDSVMFARPEGGVLTMKPFSTIEIIGNPRGADIINNTFRGGFTFNAEILELGGGRIQTPVFREAPVDRSDCFSCYSPDFDSGTGGPVVFNIEGLTLIYEPVTSAKIYASASSQLNNIHLKRFGVNFVELQVAFNNGAETKTFDKLIFDNVEQLSTRGGNTQVGSLFLLTSPRYLFPSDFTISLINLRSDVEFLELRDIESIGVGQWDGTITNTFRGVRTTSTQKRTYLSGSTPVENIKTVYTPSSSIGSEITELSNAQGITKQVLTYGEIQPSGVFFTGVIPQETWTVVAVGYNQRIASSSFRLLDNARPETLDESLQVVIAPVNEIDKSVVDAYTEIQNANQLHDASVAFVVDNPVGITNWLLTQSGDTIDAGSFNITILQSGATFAFDGTAITINSSAFTGNITTTGTVTDAGGVVNGTIIDSTADSALTFSGIDNWIVFANSTDQDANTNPLGSGASTENYRFTYDGSTYYLRITAGDDTIFKAVTPAQAGVTEVSLTTAGLLTALSSSVNALPTALNNADAVWDEAYSAHTTAGTYGKLFDLWRKTNVAVEGQITGTPTNSSFTTDLTAIDGAFDHQLIVFTSGVLTGEARPIQTYLNASGAITLQEPLTAPPAAEDEFIIANIHVHPISEIQAGLATSVEIAGVESKIDMVETIADAILADTNELQINQGDWATATGFSTHEPDDIWTVVSRTLTETVGVTAQNIEDISIAVEAALIDETDGQQIIQAIINAIDASDVNQADLVIALRNDIERTGGAIDNVQSAIDALETKAQADTRQANLVAEHNATQATLVTVNDNINLLPDAADINAQVDIALADYDGPTKAELDSAINGLNDLEQVALVAAIRADLERTGGSLDNLESAEDITPAQVWAYLEADGITADSMGAILVEALRRAKQSAQFSA